MPGFGDSSFGTSVFGFGEVTPTDPRATMPVLARHIDPTTKDFVPAGRTLQATTPVKQRLLIALSSELGSGAAAPELGIRVKGMKMGRGFEAMMRDRVRIATRQIVEVEKKAKIIDVIVSRKGNQGLLTVFFLDLTNPNNKPEKLTIPLRS